MLNVLWAIIHSPAFEKYGIIGLFFNGVFSSIIPLPVEATTIALLAGGSDKWLVFFVLTLGSIVGGFMAYYIGLTGSKAFKKKNHDKKEREKIKRGKEMLKKYGWALIFLSPWIPIFSDIVPLIAGSKKYDFRKFTIAMTTGKAFKALAIVFALNMIKSIL